MTHELGKNWRDTTVKPVLDNVIYRGDYLDGKTTGNPVLYENVVPPIVPKELWQECQNQKGKNSRNYTRNVLYLFFQKVRCPKCGRIMAGKAPGGKKKHKYVYYKCASCKDYIREDYLEQKLAPLIMQLTEFDSLIKNQFGAVLSNIQLPNGRHLIYCSSPKTHEEVIKYVNKLKELYDVDYIEFDVIKKEKGELFDIKKADVKNGYRAIKMIPIIPVKREGNILKKRMGLLAIPQNKNKKVKSRA